MRNRLRPSRAIATAGRVAALAAALVVLAGCSGSLLASATPAASASRTGSSAALRGQVGVIRRWARALRRGDVDAAAALFAVPSYFSTGGQPIEIHDRIQARAANASLSCGAEFVSAALRGRLIAVLFRLTGRPGIGGSSCRGGVGQTARTDFLIERGKIVAWIQGPNVAPTTPGPTLLAV